MDKKSENWAKRNRISLLEPTRKIVGRKGFGYPIHPYRSQRSVSLTRGLDEQWKWNPKTLVRTKSSRSVSSRKGRRIDGTKCGLWSNSAIEETTKDPIHIADQIKFARKMKRRQNRNNRARRCTDNAIHS